jgi:CheY-like chemotaxis protein
MGGDKAIISPFERIIYFNPYIITPKSWHGIMKTVYVDDNISILELVSAYFDELVPSRVLVTDDPLEAVHMVSDGSVDLVASEYDIRPYGGPWLFRSVREIVPDMPFIFVTFSPPPARLMELLDKKDNVLIVCKNSTGGFLRDLHSAIVEAHRQGLKA